MRRPFLFLPALLVTYGCTAWTGEDPSAEDAGDVVQGAQTQPAEVVRPPATARTEAEFDTTTPEEQAAAREVPAAGSERALGRTVASLGSPSEAGFWLKTPLVREEVRGRVIYPENGRSVQLTLIPIDAPPTAGSRMSLSALRLLELPLTGLTEVEVYTGG